MRRRYLAVVLSGLAGAGVLAAAACANDGGSLLGADGTGGASGGGPNGGDASLDALSAGDLAKRAESMFRALEPDLDKTCGGSCHQDGATGGAPRWLAPPDAYVSIRAYAGIITPDPDQSKLLTKGPHAGPALLGDLASRVRDWLSVEALLLTKQVLPTTDPFTVNPGPNAIDVSKAGTNVPGTTITFNATINGALLTMSQVRLKAPPTLAVHVAHPLFVMVPITGADKPDPVDSFSNVDQTVNPGAADLVGPGELLLTSWAAGMKLRIAFTKLEVGKATDAGADSGAGGGCHSVATFTSSAVPAIQNNTCLTCHQGQNGAATGALDMSLVGQDDTSACAQALTKVNLQNKPQSPILLAPTGGIVNHPYQVQNTQGWIDAINGWISNE